MTRYKEELMKKLAVNKNKKERLDGRICDCGHSIDDHTVYLFADGTVELECSKCYCHRFPIEETKWNLDDRRANDIKIIASKHEVALALVMQNPDIDLRVAWEQDTLFGFPVSHKIKWFETEP